MCEIQIKGGDLFFMERMTKLKFIESSCLSNKNKKMLVKIKIIIVMSGVNERDRSNKQAGQSVS